MLWAALLTVYVVWGSTYLAIRVMVETMPPMLSAGARFALAGAVFLLVLRLRGGLGRVRVSRRQLAAAGLVGVLLCFGGNGLVTVAEEEVPSGLAALIIGAVPLWVVLLRLMHSERVHRGTLASVAVGFAGLAVLVLPGDRPGDAPLWGVLLIVLASLSWATGSFYSRRVRVPEDPFVSTGYQMLLGGGAMLLVGFARSTTRWSRCCVAPSRPSGCRTGRTGSRAYATTRAPSVRGAGPACERTPWRAGRRRGARSASGRR